MNKQEATNIFNQIQKEYHRIKNSKYKNIELELWQKKYLELLDIKPFLHDNPFYQRLINGLSQILTKCEKLDRCRTESKGWINASERGINKALPTLVRKSKTEVEFPYEWIDQKYGHRCSITNGYWGARNYMAMDALGYFYLLKEGGDRLPDITSELFHDMESIRKREVELDQITPQNGSGSMNSMLTENDIESIMKSKHWIRFNDKIFRKFTGLKLSSSDILKLLIETSRVEFILAFPVRLKLSQKEIRERPYLMNMFSRLFEFGYVEKARESDGVVRRREYFVTFNTILGELFVHNLKMKNYDWVREDLYSLPASAQIFFRKFIINNDHPRIPINLENIAQKLNLIDSNKPNLENTITTNVLDPLMRQGFIISYEKTIGLQGTKFIVHRDFGKSDPK
jgi:hypothetical protein